jgi:hypothetical protein
METKKKNLEERVPPKHQQAVHVPYVIAQKHIHSLSDEEEEEEENKHKNIRLC